MKTIKAIKKRIKFSAKNKLLIRKAGQDHFNAKEKTNVKLRKRNKKQFPKAYKKTIKKLLKSK